MTDFDDTIRARGRHVGDPLALARLFAPRDGLRQLLEMTPEQLDEAMRNGEFERLLSGKPETNDGGAA